MEYNIYNVLYYIYYIYNVILYIYVCIKYIYICYIWNIETPKNSLPQILHTKTGDEPVATSVSSCVCKVWKANLPSFAASSPRGFWCANEKIIENPSWDHGIPRNARRLRSGSMVVRSLDIVSPGLKKKSAKMSRFPSLKKPAVADLSISFWILLCISLPVVPHKRIHRI